MQARHRCLLQHNAIGRSAQREGSGDRPLAQEPLNLIVGNVPIAQPLQRCRRELTRRILHIRWGLAEIQQRLFGEKIFLLHGDKLGRSGITLGAGDAGSSDLDGAMGAVRGVSAAFTLFRSI